MAVDPELLTGLGAAAAIFFSAAGSALASAHSGTFAIRGKDYKSFIPIIISGVLAIYGIIVSVLLVGKLDGEMTTVNGYRNLSAGLAVGLTCLASGWGMAKFIRECNEQGTMLATRAATTQMTEPLVGRPAVANFSSPPPFPKLCMVMVYLEAIGLYGLIVALFLMG